MYTGIFLIAGDEAGLAIIIGHEVAHALARHPGDEVAVVLVLSKETGESSPGLITKAERTRSWPKVAREYGGFLATLMRQLRVVERTARKLVEASR